MKTQIENEIIFIYDSIVLNRILHAKYLKIYVNTQSEVFGEILDNINSAINNDIESIKNLYTQYSYLSLNIDNEVKEIIFPNTLPIQNDFYLYTYL